MPWPHGPTEAGNLGSLCRRHHRLKTHGGWQLTSPAPGVFVWTSRYGHRYLRDHSGTTDLTDWPQHRTDELAEHGHGPDRPGDRADLPPPHR